MKDTMGQQEWLNIFGDNLVDMLRKANLTQEDLSEMTGLSRSTISRYIRKRQMPSPKALVNIAEALECDYEGLMWFGDIIE